MNIGFLVPIDGMKKYGDVYDSIVRVLEKKGHSVTHPLAVTDTLLRSWDEQKYQDYFTNYYNKANKSDLIVAECSYPCVNIGLEIANAVQHGKEIIILKAKNTNLSLSNFDPLHTKKNIYVYEYQTHNLKETIEGAITYIRSEKYQKYNILFTPEIVAKLNEITKRKNIPKSVYIRQLIEKGLEEDSQ